MDKAKLRGSELILVNCSLEELIVTENDITLLLALRTPLGSRELRLAIEVETGDVVPLVVFTLKVDYVLENSGDDLLACPQRLWLENSWLKSVNLGNLVLFKKLS